MENLILEIDEKCNDLKKSLLNLGDEAYNSLRNSKEICQFTLSNENLILPELDKLTYQGIYFFEIKNNTDFKTFGEWIDNFRPRWEKEIKKHTPKIYSKWIEKHLKSEELKEWIPFYIGKSENIKSRLNEHIINSSETTSSLKLNLRKNLSNETFRLKIVKIDIDNKNYDLVLPTIELYLRNKISPIIGKQ